MKNVISLFGFGANQDKVAKNIAEEVLIIQQAQDALVAGDVETYESLSKEIDRIRSRDMESMNRLKGLTEKDELEDERAKDTRPSMLFRNSIAASVAIVVTVLLVFNQKPSDVDLVSVTSDSLHFPTAEFEKNEEWLSRSIGKENAIPIVDKSQFTFSERLFGRNRNRLVEHSAALGNDRFNRLLTSDQQAHSMLSNLRQESVDLSDIFLIPANIVLGNNQVDISFTSSRQSQPMFAAWGQDLFNMGFELPIPGTLQFEAGSQKAYINGTNYTMDIAHYRLNSNNSSERHYYVDLITASSCSSATHIANNWYEKVERLVNEKPELCFGECETTVNIGSRRVYHSQSFSDYQCRVTAGPFESFKSGEKFRDFAANIAVFNKNLANDPLMFNSPNVIPL